MGVEPIRSKEHSPLKTACLPIPPSGQDKKNPFLNGFSDLAGARTQDPLLKREMLYQLSYQVGFKFEFANIIALFQSARK